MCIRDREWETAATRPAGEYPWGEGDPDPERASFGKNVDSATPVGVYPRGNGPHGHCDLAGNVLEWCSDYAELDPDVWEPEELAEGGRVVKGGCWFVSAENLRSAIRLRSRARYRLVSVGFRVCVSSASL